MPPLEAGVGSKNCMPARARRLFLCSPKREETQAKSPNPELLNLAPKPNQSGISAVFKSHAGFIRKLF